MFVLPWLFCALVAGQSPFLVSEISDALFTWNNTAGGFLCPFFPRNSSEIEQIRPTNSSILVGAISAAISNYWVDFFNNSLSVNVPWLEGQACLLLTSTGNFTSISCRLRYSPFAQQLYKVSVFYSCESVQLF